MLNGLVHSGEIVPSELTKSVEQTEEMEYDRKSMLLIASHCSAEGSSKLADDLEVIVFT